MRICLRPRATHAGEKQLLSQVRRLKGHPRPCKKALSDNSECQAVLRQIAAIRGAVNGWMAEVLEGHIRKHRRRPDTDPAQRGKDMAALASTLQSYLK